MSCPPECRPSSPVPRSDVILTDKSTSRLERSRSPLTARSYTPKSIQRSTGHPYRERTPAQHKPSKSPSNFRKPVAPQQRESSHPRVGPSADHVTTATVARPKEDWQSKLRMVHNEQSEAVAKLVQRGIAVPDSVAVYVTLEIGLA